MIARFLAWSLTLIDHGFTCCDHEFNGAGACMKCGKQLPMPRWNGFEEGCYECDCDEPVCTCECTCANHIIRRNKP